MNTPPEDDLWTCPACGRRFAKPNAQHVCARYTVQEHLDKATPHALALYQGLLALAAQCGEFFEEATKTGIMLKTPGIFMSIGLKKKGLNCSIWLPEPIRHPRIRSNYPVSNRYAVHFQIHELEELDAQLKGWLCRAYYFLEAA
ncbi:MAG TPA: DUF5655 domain-containing protein [Anaerolineales bacterium]|nr:DUF5655 domain-containing protein [Anaerolineales bacterium]